MRYVFVYGVHSLWLMIFCFFFFKQKTAYELRISDWSSDVCSSDLSRSILLNTLRALEAAAQHSDFERAAPCWHCCGRGRGRGAFAALVEFCSDIGWRHVPI